MREEGLASEGGREGGREGRSTGFFILSHWFLSCRFINENMPCLPCGHVHCDSSSSSLVILISFRGVVRGTQAVPAPRSSFSSPPPNGSRVLLLCTSFLRFGGVSLHGDVRICLHESLNRLGIEG